MISTPDRRVRVFVSSTLEELASERTAAREAIEELRLTPVLFELGARTHPPRSLYQSYVEQSDVFVGIYGERYGWVAPGMEISGLEDEYRLAETKPKLLYVKNPAPGRDERLRAFVARIEHSGDVSYRSFTAASELRALLADDLAVLLSERFQTPTAPTQPIRPRLPAPVDRFVGREAELDRLEHDLRQRAGRLYTITGPGGVGKTRLALEAARRLEDAFAQGAHLVALSDIADPELVVPTIQSSLDVAAASRQPFDAVADGLRDADLLLVLDNFEQVRSAAPEIARLLEACPRLTALVTSRAVLNVRGEREFRVTPLHIPEESADTEELARSDAVALFVERAQAVNPAFSLNEDNRAAVIGICRRLDGLPLAIELAAAQARLLPPEAILARLEQRLGLAVPAAQAYPERHQTLRAAIDWSFGLLSEDETSLFACASVFRGGWTLDALDAVHGGPSLDGVAALVDKSLVVPDVSGAEPRFSMLPTIREYAAEKLAETGGDDVTRDRHAAFYLELIRDVGARLNAASGHEAGLARLDAEEENVRAALDWLLRRGDAAAVAEAAWWLLPYWALRERFVEARRWLSEALAADGLPDQPRARLLAVSAVLAMWAQDYERVVGPSSEALAVFRALEDDRGIALAQLPLGVIQSVGGDREAGLAMLEDSHTRFERVGHEWGVTMTMSAMTWAFNATGADAPIELFEETVRRAGSLGHETETIALGALARRRAIRGEREEAKRLFAEALRRTVALNATVGVALYLDLLGDLAAHEGRDRLATRLSASAETMFATAKTPIAPLVGEREPRLASLRERLGDDTFAAEWKAGRARTLDEAAREALEWAEPNELRAR